MIAHLTSLNKLSPFLLSCECANWKNESRGEAAVAVTQHSGIEENDDDMLGKRRISWLEHKGMYTLRFLKISFL